MSSVSEPELLSVCPECGTPISKDSLSCSNCHRFTHAAELEQIAGKANAAALGGQIFEARELWLKALPLLPNWTVHRKSVESKIAELDAQIRSGHAPSSQGWKKKAAGLGPVALAIWKFKTFALLLLTKGKLLLLGLTKLSTLLSMLVSFGVYWKLYGWPFALGLVLSIYIHEMGHVMALRRYGIPAGAPMFIPFLGAMIQLRSVSITPVQDSRIGLAGPLNGLGAAAFALAVYYATGSEIWRVIAHFGAVINLFNLIPIWQLDGGRGFHSLSRMQRGVVAGLAGLLWMITSESMLLLITLGAAYRLFTKDDAKQGDQLGWMQFLGLLVALSALLVFAPVR